MEYFLLSVEFSPNYSKPNMLTLNVDNFKIGIRDITG